MAKLYRKKYPIPMPQGAEIVTRRGRKFAQWTDGYGTLKTAPLSDDGKKIMHEAGCWYARFTDADGVRRRISTNCNDMQAAQKVLADLMAKVEKIKSGIITPAEAQTAEHCQAAVEDHVADYLRHLSIKLVRGRPVSRQYIKNVKGRLERLIRECKFKCLRDFNCQTVEQWLANAVDAEMSAATRNEYLTSIAAFGSWAVRHGRMTANIFKAIGKADRNLDHRRMRRALAANEVAALLNAAAIRPLAECGRPSVKLDDGEWTYATINATNLRAFYDLAMEKLQDHPRRIEKFQRLGRQRALFYHIAVTTGLRRREIASLTLGQIHLDGVTPHIELHGIDSKNAKNANIPLREELVNSIRSYIAEVFGGDVPLTTKLFSHVPTIRVFDADLQAAGIAKSDHRERTVDIHALRHTFGTHLSVAGVAPRVAQAAMRHSRIELTMNLYTDPALLDIAGAIKALPSFVAKENVA